MAKSTRDALMSGAVTLEGVVVTASPAAVADELDSRGHRAAMARTQRVGGRLFIQRGSTWTDLRHGDSLRVVTVAPFSDAYFAVLRALPELVQPAALEPAVLVAGRRVSIKIVAGGTTIWAAGELARVVRDFR